jgi:hypothetical protein
MSGGTFQSQNKVRAGAYINFKSVPKQLTKVGTRGIATIAIPLTWGPQLVELYSTDLTDGSSLAKVGLDVTDDEALILRKLLQHTYKAFIYRLDAGGTKSEVTVGTNKYTAKYAGTFGNKLQVVVTQNLYAYTGVTTGNFYTDQELAVGTVVYEEETLETAIGVVTAYDSTANEVTIDNGTAEAVTVGTSNAITYTVHTLVNGVRKDTQTVSDGTQLVDNDYIEFDGVATLQPTAGSALTGGTDGTVSDVAYTQYFAEMGSRKFDTMGLPYATSKAVLDAAKLFITQQNEQYGRKCKLVVKNSMSDSDYVINSINGYETTEEIVSPEIFVAEVTGLDAGCAINESLTYYVIAQPEVAVDIVDKIQDKDIEKALNAGKFVLSKRDDGAIVIEKDINSLHTFTVDKNYAFSKNRVKRTLDEIANTCKLVWEKSYVGKVDNNETGRRIYKSDLAGYLNTLQNDYAAIQRFDSEKDLEVLAGQDIDAVVVNLVIQPVDSMEKLYMTVKVNA